MIGPCWPILFSCFCYKTPFWLYLGKEINSFIPYQNRIYLPEKHFISVFPSQDGSGMLRRCSLHIYASKQGVRSRVNIYKESHKRGISALWEYPVFILLYLYYSNLPIITAASARVVLPWGLKLLSG